MKLKRHITERHEKAHCFLKRRSRMLPKIFPIGMQCWRNFGRKRIKKGRRILRPAGRSMSNFGETSSQSRMSLQQRRALKLAWRILRRFSPVRERLPKKPILQEKNVRGERWLSLRGRPSRMQTLLPGICSTGEEKMGLTGLRKMQHMPWAKQ